jgi:hypothetical protein
MKNKGVREDGCCWVLIWDTWKRVLLFFYFCIHISVSAKYRQILSKMNLFGAPCLLTWKSPNNLAVLDGN